MKRAFKDILPILLLLVSAQLIAQEGDKKKGKKKV